MFDHAYLTHVSKSIFLCYPVDSVQVSSYSDRPVVGVNRRMTQLEESSHPQRVKAHHHCRDNEASTN